MLGVYIATSETLHGLASSGRMRLQLFTATYSICFGMCNGQGYTIPLRLCWDLFPNNKGMITGIITCGFGIGSFLFGIVSTMMINPNNLKMETVGLHQVYGPEVANNTMTALRKLAVYWAILTLIALFLIKVDRPQEQDAADK